MATGSIKTRGWRSLIGVRASATTGSLSVLEAYESDELVYLKIQASNSDAVNEGGNIAMGTISNIGTVGMAQAATFNGARIIIGQMESGAFAVRLSKGTYVAGTNLLFAIYVKKDN